MDGKDTGGTEPERGDGHVPAGPNPPVFQVPETAARRFRATVLDPGSAERSGDSQRRPRPVVYVPDRLLLPGLQGGRLDDSLGVLEEIGQEMGFAVRVLDRGLSALARELEVADVLDAATHTPVELVNDTERALPPIDAWNVIARARAQKGDAAVRGWSLNHVLMSAGGYWGGVGGYWGGVGGYWGGVGGYWGGVGGYWGGVGAPGVPAGRGPVVLSLDAPQPTGRWTPAVAVFDSGLGAHEWFDGSPLVTRDPRADGRPIGLRFPAAEDPENVGVTVDRLNGFLDPLAGHGTFVSGVVRQHAPDAHLVVVPVMYGDGAADERDVLDALNLLAVWHLSAMRGGAGDTVDVINFSLGYYHEDDEPDTEEGAIFAVLGALAARGVAVVAAAGNGSTTQEFWPAALSTHTAKGAVPVTSVGALEPAGREVALFSNSGDWVTDYRRGSGIVSTMPTTLQGSVVSPVDGRPPGLPERGTGDADDYACGFGLWSGTSFAAPVSTGLIASALAATELPPPGPERAGVVAALVAGALHGGP